MTHTAQSTAEEAARLRKLYAAVVLAAIDDAIRDEARNGNGIESIVRWSMSRDGREVLMKAGIEPGLRTADGLRAFVARGKPTSTALSAKTRPAMLERA